MKKKTRTGPYYMDAPTEEETYYGVYTAVIRDIRRVGWVFRFSGPDRGLASQTLRALNHPVKS